MTIEEQLEKALADVAAANDLLNKVQADLIERDQQVKEVENLKLTIIAKDDALAALRAQVADGQAKITSLTEQVTKLSTEATDAETRAAQIVAAAGVPAVELSKTAASTGAPTTKAEAWEQYGQLPDERAKTAFYQKHKAVFEGK